jgi:hypothetical protein
MANISVRGVDEQALRRLKQLARRRGISLNRLILEMLQGSGQAQAARGQLDHTDMDDLAGTWTAAEARQFEKDTATFRQIDETLWR